MICIKVNNSLYSVKEKVSILEACKFIGILIPRFCYHESLSIAGNCRMCLIEIDKIPKPIAACVTIVSENISIFLNTPIVKKARENIIEFLLLNHPLDCPICDQGGECDLQDQVKNFGNSFTRFFVVKRGLEDKNVGPLIQTIMTRCIHCTRCVRFGVEIAGVEAMGTLGRGSQMEIGSYLNKFFSSEVSGNVIDLCPVGALTAKPYSFQSRPWESDSLESIDLSDGFGSNIYINFKGFTLLRVLPKKNNNLNGNIISDKIRFSYDSLKRQRIKSFSVKVVELQTNCFFQKAVNYNCILENLKQRLKLNSNTLILINEELTLENLILLKNISKKNNKILLRRIKYSTQLSNFFNKPLSSTKDIINKSIKNCFLLSCNIKLESTILNSKIRIKSLTERLFIYGFNNKFKSIFKVKFINFNTFSIINFISGKNFTLSKDLIFFFNPLILINSNFVIFDDIMKITNIFQKVNNSAIIFDIKEFSNSLCCELLNIKLFNKNNLN